MPGGDGTGPMGMGPMTGRALGDCIEFGVPRYMNPAQGRGYGMGRGRRGGFGGGGRGWRHMYHATGMPGWMRVGSGGPMPAAPPPDAERNFLKNQAEALETDLAEIRQRISVIEAGAKTDKRSADKGTKKAGVKSA